MAARMSEAGFRRLLETFGADFHRWPADRIAAAEALCAASATARAARERAARLDALLAEDRAAETVPPARIQAITDAALVRIAAQDRELDVDAIPIWQWLFTRPVGAVIATAMLAGIVLGLLVPAGPPQGALAASALFGTGARSLVGIL